MNHLGDTNKMVDTPRTDAKRSGSTHFMGDWVDANFACQLERELNAANSEIEEKRKDVVWLATEKAKLENYVMRLEEALEGTVKWIVVLADSGDAGFWNPEEQSAIIAARAALKKEAKL